MEPSAVSSCSRVSSLHNNTTGSERRKDVLLRIDPHIGYASSNKTEFEELPENFLETVSPQQSQANDFSHSELLRTSSTDMASDARFLNGSASDTLSPITRDSHLIRPNGSRPLDVRPLQYIKEESPSPGFPRSEFEPVYHLHAYEHPLENLDTSNRSRSGSPLSSEMSSSAAAMSGEASSPSSHFHPSKRIRTQTRPRTPPVEPTRKVRSSKPFNATAKTVVYSTNDLNDPLNAEIDDHIYIDTKDLCKRVAYELKQHAIPQAIFAERILCRSQGTLSDLLRNPKPWNRLKSGRETFRRMYNWIQQPLSTRLAILDMCKVNPAGSDSESQSFLTLPAKSRSRPTSSSDENIGSQKRPRLVFTDIQKRTLHAIFKETQRPSREMQQTIADHLKLDMSTVSNFFMNARRRSRNGSTAGDQPAPYQQVKAITPPPDSEIPRKLSRNAQHRFAFENGSDADEENVAGTSSSGQSTPAPRGSRSRAAVIKIEPEDGRPQSSVKVKTECPEDDSTVA